MKNLSRRSFLSHTLTAAAATSLVGSPLCRQAPAAEKPGSKMRLGLVTYQWAQDWDLDTIFKNLEASGVLGIEPRTTHAHKVERDLSAAARKEIKKRFDDSPVVLAGLGSDERFDNPDPAVLKKAIEATKDFVRLSHDLGSTGVKVKPNSFHKGVDHEKTIDQIARSLDEVGAFAGEFGQQIRLEVHGQCAPPTIMKQIMDRVKDPNVGICWNSNPQDLRGKGFEYHFDLLKDRFGATSHIRNLDYTKYPFGKLVDRMVEMDYDGWLLMECVGKLDQPVNELARQQKLFEKMVADAQKRLG